MIGKMSEYIGMSLLSIQSHGFLWCLLIAVICTIIVHSVKLVMTGYRLSKKLPPEPPQKPEKKPEPVYFLVERKKKRAKTEYDEPKKISFQ